MNSYNLVASSDESTVLAEYIAESARSYFYQSEADLEHNFILQLQSQGYEYLRIHDEAALVDNLRFQIEQLNSYRFSDMEWERFFLEIGRASCRERV